MQAIKISIIYFSGTGNTWWVATKLTEKLTKQGNEVALLSFESMKKDEDSIQKILNESDIVGFGYPIYGSDVPDNFRAFLRDLPKVSKKVVFIFTTMLLFSGDGAMVAARILRRKGFKVKQAINIRMPNNLKLPYPIFKRLKIRNGDDLKDIKAKASLKIDKLVRKIIAGKRWIQGADPFNIMGGLMQRVEMRLVNLSIYARNFFVDKETCTECMQCVDSCPTNNIAFENGTFNWKKNCILCMRCYNLCPEDAIQYKKATLDREKYTRYKGPGNGFTVKNLKK